MQNMMCVLQQDTKSVMWEVSKVKGPRGTDSARVVSVIETRALRGTGTEKDKCRIVIQYWDFEGNLLAENDPCEKEKE